jgi:hypothetical protein
MSNQVVDAEIVEEAPSNEDKQFAEWGAKVATIFAREPQTIDHVLAESEKQFGFRPNLVRNVLGWLEKRGLATAKIRNGVLYWGKPVDVRGLVDATAAVVEACAGPVEAMGGAPAAKVMREAAATARAVPAAVDGIKREGKPVVDAFSKLGGALKDAGFFRVREPIDVQLQKRREEAERAARGGAK